MPTTLGELASLCGQPDGQAMPARLVSAARSKGLWALEAKISSDDLARCDAAVIALLLDDTYAVVERRDRGILKVTRATGGPQLMPQDDFAKVYSGVAVLVTKEQSALPTVAYEGPDARFDRHWVDFGRVSEGTRVTQAFEFSNVGTSDLVVSKIETTCGCTEAYVSEERVAPGQTAGVLLSFDTTRHLGLQSYSASLQLNDPVTPNVRLSIVGVVIPLRVLVSPRVVELPAVRRGQGGTREVYLFDPGFTDLEVTGAASDNPLLTCAVAAIRAEGDPPRYRVVVTLSQDSPIGEVAGKVVIHTNHPTEPEISIPVTATVKGPIDVHPQLLSLGIVQRGCESRARVLVSTTNGQPLHIREIESSSAHVSVKWEPRAEEREYLVTAILGSSAPAGSVRSEVVIHTDDPDQPTIAVPVQGLVKD